MVIEFTIHAGWVGLGIICFGIYTFICVLTLEKNPLTWPTIIFGHTVICNDISFDENEYMRRWIVYNIKYSKYTVCRIYGDKYKFLSKTDAMAFKLRWG